MKVCQWISRFRTGLLSLIALLPAGQAFCGYVEINNQSEHRACFGSTTSFYNEGEGSGSVSEGWTCIGTGGTFRVNLDPNDYVYISAVDEEGHDFLAGRLSNYSAVETYAPATIVDSFGVEKVARIDGSFSYAYSIDDAPWSDDVIVSDRGALDVALTTHGFRKITGRVFRGADYPGGIRVVINF